MASNYPAGFDALPNVPLGANQDEPDHRLQHNNVNDAARALQQTLGKNPQGAHPTVADRLGATVPGFSRPDGAMHVGEFDPMDPPPNPAGALSIGLDAVAEASGAVALGPGSVADTNDAVAVGHHGHTRRIIHVTEGEAPSDAATISQLPTQPSDIGAQPVGDYLTEGDLPDLSAYVKSVNGTGPDSSGNVTVSGGGGGVQWPILNPNGEGMPIGSVVGVANMSATEGRRYAQRFYIPTPIRLDGCILLTAATPDASCRLGIYDTNLDLVTETPLVSLTASGAKDVPFATSPVVSAGYYWMQVITVGADASFSSLAWAGAGDDMASAAVVSNAWRMNRWRQNTVTVDVTEGMPDPTVTGSPTSAASGGQPMYPAILKWTEI